jgi:hypothetical protein
MVKIENPVRLDMFQEIVDVWWPEDGGYYLVFRSVLREDPLIFTSPFGTYSGAGTATSAGFVYFTEFLVTGWTLAMDAAYLAQPMDFIELYNDQGESLSISELNASLIDASLSVQNGLELPTTFPLSIPIGIDELFLDNGFLVGSSVGRNAVGGYNLFWSATQPADVELPGEIGTVQGTPALFSLQAMPAPSGSEALEWSLSFDVGLPTRQKSVKVPKANAQEVIRDIYISANVSYDGAALTVVGHRLSFTFPNNHALSRWQIDTIVRMDAPT